MGNLVLIVDDEPVIVKMLKLRLNRAGYTTVSAADGAEALQQVQQNRPDVILLDIRLPVLDGPDVCRRIKADERLATIPIILFSAADDDENRLLCAELGAQDVLSKPFEPEELLEKIERYAHAHPPEFRID